ncbi:LysR family transcriptional regulator [Montanilutibacter psychrotolerans]|uniref:LysR family transcriptional regulator n=1 Tax=Montanilutibacter psychrotolerans TaxID=1327343 RepID=A0A3M8SV63_9GAMM|nr:LysR family transcriptional regulator [Lysobacter psychrotolerans]RNF85231.1 LysR family transcriptional regulator [Lysobacter psychrotolerans]
MNQEAAPSGLAIRNGTLVDVASMAAFVAVINAASFTGAARRLGTSKSVISRRISEMELHLGARLIDRTAARVSPTEVGAVYFVKCVRILESIEAANDFVASSNGGFRGVVRVSVPRFFCARVVAPMLAEFAGRYPDLKVEIDVDERESSLHDTGFDLALRIGRLPDSSMVARTISYSSMWVCASPSYLEAHGTPESPDELEQRDCLVHSSGEMQSGWCLDSAGPRIFRVRERIRSACYFHLLEAAKSGLGLALLPSYVASDLVASGQLKIVLAQCAPRPNPVSIVYPLSRKASQKVQALISFLMERIPNPPPWEGANPERPSGQVTA